VIAAAVAVLAAASSAHATNQTVGVTSNLFTPKNVTVTQGETVTWNNTSGIHNVHFDDGSFDQPASPTAAPWTVSRTFTGTTPGTYRYYCELHGGPGGAGMSGTVTVTTPGFPRPKGATPVNTSLVIAYKPCSASNSTHGAPLSSPSCNPPVQQSNFLTVGTADSNGKAANSIGSTRAYAVPGDPGTPADEADVLLNSSITDVRRKTDLADYAGELQAALTLRITDKNSGGSGVDPATVSDLQFTFTLPCAVTSDTSIGSACSVATSADAVMPGAVQEGDRASWELGQVKVFDGGPDGVASTADNTLFAVEGLFIP
jgi:plastocyanin